jgi:hypothetical protein
MSRPEMVMVPERMERRRRRARMRELLPLVLGVRKGAGGGFGGN